MSDARELPTWIQRPRLAAKTLRFSPLLVGIDGRDELTNYELQSYLGNLFDVITGERDWESALKEYLKDKDYLRAARCVAELSPSSSSYDNAALQQAWEAALTGWRTKLAELRQYGDKLAGATADTADAKSFLDDVEAKLNELPSAQSNVPLWQALSNLAPTVLTGIEENLTLASVALDEASVNLKRREREVKRQLLERKRDADEKLNDVLWEHSADGGDSSFLHAAENLRRLLDRAFRGRDLDDFEALQKLANRLHNRDPAACEVVDARYKAISVASGQSAANRTDSPQAVGAWGSPSEFTGWDSLSEFSRREFAELSATNAEHGDVDSAALGGKQLDRGWRRTRVDERRKAVCGLIRDGSQDARKNQVMRAHFLLAAAKLRLLDGDGEFARILFTDALRWISASADAFAEHSHEWERFCACGLLFSIAMPYLSSEERFRALRPENLDVLFLMPVDRLLLVKLEELRLYPVLAFAVLDMELTTAQVLVSKYLAAYFAKHSLAAEAFLRALLMGGVRRPWVAVTLSVDIVAVLEAPFAGQWHNQVSALTAESGTSEQHQITKQTVDTLRGWLMNRSEWTDFTTSMGTWLQSLAQFLDDRAEEDKPKLSLRLLTPEIDPEGDQLVLEVHYLRGTLPLSSIRFDVTLAWPHLDDTGVGGGEQLAHSEPYMSSQFLDAPATVPALFPGEKREIAIPLAGKSTPPAKTTQLVVRPSAFRSKDGVRVSLQERPAQFALMWQRVAPENLELKNPYLVGRAVRHRDAIFGRDDQITKITRALVGEKQDNAVLVLGERRIGKTTLLHAVTLDQFIQERYRWVIVDLEDLRTNETAASFYRDRLIRSIRDALERADIPVPDPTAQLMKASPGLAFREFMRECDRSLREHETRLLLIVDELEALLRIIEAQQPREDETLLGMDVMATLRAVILELEYVSFILCGDTPVLQRHMSQRDNRLFKLAISVEVPPLEEKDARRLVREPMRTLCDVLPAAADRVVRETGRQPLLIQLVCHELFEQMRKHHARVATVRDVEHIFTTCVGKPRAFSYLEDYLTQPNDRRIAHAVAALQSGNTYVPIDALHRYLRFSSPDIERDTLHEHLDDLVDRASVVFERKVASASEYRLSIGLFAAYLRHRETPVQTGLVVRE